jgi:hypothetical protein
MKGAERDCSLCVGEASMSQEAGGGGKGGGERANGQCLVSRDEDESAAAVVHPQHSPLLLRCGPPSIGSQTSPIARMCELEQ